VKSQLVSWHFRPAVLVVFVLTIHSIQLVGALTAKAPSGITGDNRYTLYYVDEDKLEPQLTLSQIKLTLSQIKSSRSASVIQVGRAAILPRN
jgi:hypothetical protein